MVQRLLFDLTRQKNGQPLSFEMERGRGVIVRNVKDSTGRNHRTELPLVTSSVNASDLPAAFDVSWLRSAQSPWRGNRRRVLRTADIFSGCGGLALGACDAAWALGLDHEVALAIDHQGIIDCLGRGDLDAAARLLPDEATRVFAVAGTPEECQERLAEYLAIGLDEPIIEVSGGAGERALALEVVRRLAQR